MKRLVLLVSALVVVAVVAGLAALGIIPGVKGRYRNSDPELAVVYRAKESCSCLFVMGRDEAYCRAWTQASPDVATLDVDRVNKVVTSRALFLYRARARFMGSHEGCLVEEGP